MADLETIIEPRASGVRWRCIFGGGWGSVRGVGHSRTKPTKSDENISITYCFIPLCSETHIVGVNIKIIDGCSDSGQCRFTEIVR